MEQRTSVCRSEICEGKVRDISFFGKCMVCDEDVLEPLPAYKPKCPQCGQTYDPGNAKCWCGRILHSNMSKKETDDQRAQLKKLGIEDGFKHLVEVYGAKPICNHSWNRADLASMAIFFKMNCGKLKANAGGKQKRATGQKDMIENFIREEILHQKGFKCLKGNNEDFSHEICTKGEHMLEVFRNRGDEKAKNVKTNTQWIMQFLAGTKPPGYVINAKKLSGSLQYMEEKYKHVKDIAQQLDEVIAYFLKEGILLKKGIELGGLSNVRAT